MAMEMDGWIDIDGESYQVEKHLTKLEIYNLRQRIGNIRWGILKVRGILRLNNCAILHSGSYTCITLDKVIAQKVERLADKVK